MVKQGRVRPALLSCFQLTSKILYLGLSPLSDRWVMVTVGCPLEQSASNVVKTPGPIAFL